MIYPFSLKLEVAEKSRKVGLQKKSILQFTPSLRYVEMAEKSATSNFQNYDFSSFQIAMKEVIGLVPDFSPI